MNFLVVGCGSIGKRHIGNLLRLGQNSVVAYDARPDRLEEIQGWSDVVASPDIDEALDRHLDAVVVCTPTSLHLPYAFQAVDRGLHVLVEKPLSHSMEGVDRFVSKVAEKQIVALVGCNFRFQRGLVRIKRMLDEGRVGKPLFIRAQFGQYLPDWHPSEDYRQGYSANESLGGGIILDSIHELDYVTWLFGEPSEIFCFAGKLGNLDIDTEDTAEILLRFSDGSMGEIHMDYLQRAYNRSCEIAGEEGTIVWSLNANAVRYYSASDKQWQNIEWPDAYDVNDMYLLEMEHFLACIKGEAKPELDEVGGRRVLQLALSAKESAEQGRKISVSHGGRS